MRAPATARYARLRAVFFSLSEEKRHEGTGRGTHRRGPELTSDGAGAARVYRGHHSRQFGRRPAGRDGRSPQPVARGRRNDGLRPHGRLPIPGAAARPVRNHGRAAGISVREVVERRPRARTDSQSGSRHGRRRRHGSDQGHRGFAPHRRQAELGGRQRGGRDDPADSEGARLRRARHVGARHHQRVEKPRYPDRRSERRRQPVPHRWRRHDESVERHVGQDPPAGFRRHRPGQGQRLRGGVSRLDRRRDQRDHEVGRQRVPRRRRHLFHERRAAGRRPPDPPVESGEPDDRGVRHDAG